MSYNAFPQDNAENLHLTPPNRELLEHFSRTLAHYEVTDEDIYFNDLFTNEPIVSGELPPFLRTEGWGLQFLEELSNRRQIAIDFIPALHGNANDFKDVIAQHGQMLESIQILGLEMSKEWGSGTYTLTSDPGRREFQEAQLEWCQQNEKIVLPCELHAPPDDPLKSKLNSLWELNEYIKQEKKLPDDTPLDEPSLNAIRIINDSAYPVASPTTAG